MSHRLTAAAGLLAAAALAAPATAAADSTLTAGPIKVKGYDLTLVGSDAARDSLSVVLSKRAGGSMQMHMYSFGAGVTVKAGGAKPSIKARLGRYGSVALALGGLRSGRAAVPAGCRGTAGRLARGTFAGSLRLVLDSTYFRTVKARSLAGSRIAGGRFTCGGTDGAQSRGLMLTVMPESAGGASLMVSAIRDGAKVTQQATRMDAAASTAPASIMHLITATAPAASFTNAADLSSATVSGASPFLGGTLAFAGEPIGTMASGEVSGDFVARFDSIGAQRVPAGTSATLMQR